MVSHLEPVEAWDPAELQDPEYRQFLDDLDNIPIMRNMPWIRDIDDLWAGGQRMRRGKEIPHKTPPESPMGTAEGRCGCMKCKMAYVRSFRGKEGR